MSPSTATDAAFVIGIQELSGKRFLLELRLCGMFERPYCIGGALTRNL